MLSVMKNQGRLTNSVGEPVEQYPLSYEGRYIGAGTTPACSAWSAATAGRSSRFLRPVVRPAPLKNEALR